MIDKVKLHYLRKSLEKVTGFITNSSEKREKMDFIGLCFTDPLITSTVKYHFL